MEPRVFKIISVLSILAWSAQGDEFVNETDMHNHILDGYDPCVRPIKNSSQPMLIGIQLHMSQILDLDEKNHVMKSHVIFHQSWKDEMIHWDTEEYSAQRFVNIPRKSLWAMDLYVKNSVGATIDSLKAFHRLLPTYTLVSADGNCASYSPFVLQTSCTMDVQKFPFDTQNCTIQAGSYMYPSEQLHVLLMDPPIVFRDDVTDYGHWAVTNYSAWYRHVPYDVMMGFNKTEVEYDEITFNFLVKRNPKFYLYNIVVPTALISLVSIFSFIIPPDSGGRTPLCLTALLSNTVYAMVTSNNIPESVNKVPILSCLLFLYMGITGICTLWSVIIGRIYTVSSTYKNPPSKYTTLGGRVSYESCRKSQSKPDDDKQAVELDGLNQTNHHGTEPLDDSKDTEKVDYSDKWKRLFYYIDKLLCVIVLLIFVFGTIGFLA